MDESALLLQVMHQAAESRVWFVENILGVEKIEPWQREVLEQLDDGETKISVRSGHGVGKTTLCAWIILHFILTRVNVKIPVTAPSSKQLADGLIPECHKWLGRLPDFLRDQINTIENRIVRTDDPENNFVSFRTARAESPEALAGIHADHVLAVVDEASGVAEQVFEAAQGTMSTPGAIFILIGNPTRTRGYFFKTHTSLKHRWFTKQVSCFDSSRVDRNFIAQVRDTWGVDSNQYRVRVLGEFPEQDGESLIPLDYAESAIGRDITVRPEWPRVWGLDPGRGGDPTGFVERRDLVVTDIAMWGDANLMSIVGRILEKWNALPDNERPEAINVDSIGLGAGVADRLRELGLPAIDVNVSETISVSPSYPRLRPELWYRVRSWLEGKNVAILPGKYAPQLVGELVEPLALFTSTGKNDVESKDQMKARGVPSPNLADALCLTFAFTGAVVGGRGSFGKLQPWNKALDYAVPNIW